MVLVLDPCIIRDLGRAIFDWSTYISHVDCLYVNTPWEPIQDVSPWVVWLSGPDDPVLRHFVENEAEKEAGYLLFTPLNYPDFGRWMRQRIQIERAPEAIELVRISHPALARDIVGDNLIRTNPEGAIQQMILPDRTIGQWRHMAPESQKLPPQRGDDVTLLPELFEAFTRFNIRRANLMIWDKLDKQDRKALGGPALPSAWPELTRLSDEATQQGRTGIRSRVQYISSRCSEPRLEEQDMS
ncbi:DUF4123 domain-containing protein [Marinobacter sp. LN3S78]|uniref:DUF4123 domain-containing protein n=1 Tax=Marinobacter sp. LN3S78 TaxID=3382300 RepID=UPI00387AAB4F